MTSSSFDTYTKLLGGLEGDGFEDEVCARLGTCIADFQRIPRKPKGDGGLDGLSHEQTRGYCCYGPEQEPFKKKLKGLEEDILRKFRSDLRKLFEIEYDTKKNLITKPSSELHTIMAKGSHIKNIYLIVSWFESHRVIGALNTSFNEYKSAGTNTYVDPAAQLTIWGPKDLATLWAVDEHSIFRAEQRSFVAAVTMAAHTGAALPQIGEFDAKFDYLRAKAPMQVAALDRLAESFRKSWSISLALDNHLAGTSMTHHQALEQARNQAALDADLRSLQEPNAHRLLEYMRAQVNSHLGKAFGERLGPLSAEVADGEIARLIGECPIEWRK